MKEVQARRILAAVHARASCVWGKVRDRGRPFHGRGYLVRTLQDYEEARVGLISIVES